MTTTYLVTSTFYPTTDDIRLRLALRTCAEAKRLGYTLIIVDDSPDAVRALLTETGATVMKQSGRGMGASRRQAIRYARDAGADTIVWLEPEKYPVVGLLEPAIELLRKENMQFVLPARLSLESYPQYQELSELRANREIGMITGRHDLDYMFGPKVMSLEGVELMLNYEAAPQHDRWEILFIPVQWALQRGFRVGSVVVDYIHPAEQTAAETDDAGMNEKRDIQRRALVAGMRAETNQN